MIVIFNAMAVQKLQICIGKNTKLEIPNISVILQYLKTESVFSFVSNTIRKHSTSRQDSA